MQWQPIETAPKDATQILLWVPFYGDGRVEVGSFRVDANDEDGAQLWLDNSYDDFSCGLASRPLKPTHWMPLPSRPA